MLGAWAPSTQACYLAKWLCFKSWCSGALVDPFTCPLPKVLQFLESLAARGLATSTIRVYASAISLHRDEEVDSIFTSHAGRLFLRGLARARPSLPPAPPLWDLAAVLRMLSQHPYEPLALADDRALSMKTAFLLAVCTGLRVSDLVGFSVQDDCLTLQDDLSQVVLRPNPAFVGKSGPGARITPITLYAFPPPGELDVGGLRPLCPVRAVAAYLGRTGSFRGATRQLLVCFGGPQRGQGLSRGSLSRWLRDIISESLGPAGPGHVTAHSTRGVSASVALLHGVPMDDICKSARWSSSCAFARYYLQDVGSSSFSSTVLGAVGRGAR